MARPLSAGAWLSLPRMTGRAPTGARLGLPCARLRWMSDLPEHVPELVPARMVNEFAYCPCPRLFYS